jgi:hypothetical protein
MGPQFRTASRVYCLPCFLLAVRCLLLKVRDRCTGRDYLLQNYFARSVGVTFAITLIDLA